MEVDTNIIHEFKELNHDSIEFNKKCAKLSHEIITNRLSVVTLVENLGSLLVDTQPHNRELGLWVLTSVLGGLPLNFLDEKQLHFICTFYSDRLKDHHQVIPAVLSGILILSKFNQFPKGAASKILTSLFHNISCQQQQEQDRNKIYQIFKEFFDKYKSELLDMGLDFVYGVISAVDGERNPKNLQLLFGWFPIFLKNVQLGHLSEEAFEVLACYFPVDFKSPTNDKNMITREDLADSLANCLTAIPQFAEFCFPLILEKLDSSLEVAKLDSLKLLQNGTSTFDCSSYIQYKTEIWSQIQKELFNNKHSKIEDASLKTLTVVIAKLSNDTSINSTVKDISDTLKRNLIPDSKLFEVSSRILLSVAKASEIASDIITKEILPILINIFTITTTPKLKAKILTVSVDFFKSYMDFHSSLDLEELKAVPVLCVKSSGDDNELKVAALIGLSQISKHLNEELREILYDNIQTLIISSSKDIKFSLYECFKKLSKEYPTEIKEKFWNYNIKNSTILDNYLQIIIVLVSEDNFIESVVDILLFYLKENRDFASIVIKSLTMIITNDKIITSLVQKEFVCLLINWTLKEQESIEMETLENVAFCLKALVENQESEKQRVIVKNELAKIDLIKPKLVFLIDGILCRLKRDVEIDYKILLDLTNIVNESTNRIKEKAALLLANILNKCYNETVIMDYINQVLGNQPNYFLLAWVTKALVMRNHKFAESCINKLLEKDTNVAFSFHIIINDNYDCLSTRSNCFRSLFYQQKIFTLVSNKINEHYEPGKISSLLAFGYLIENVPKQVVLLHFKKVLKLVILTLEECDNVQILTAVLQILKEFIIEKEECVGNNISEFLTRFLKLSTFVKSMTVRILALQCLQEVALNLPVYKLLIHKQEVLEVLSKVIDDRKRFVRREAVEARTLWFVVDAPL